MAETLTPARVIEILNHYLSEMSDAILDNGGTLVAYMGDGIMAVFGARSRRTIMPTGRSRLRARCSASASRASTSGFAPSSERGLPDGDRPQQRFGDVRPCRF